jgi:hypothetical protein
MGLSVYFPAYKHWQGQHPYSQLIYLPSLQTSSYYVAIVLVCALQLHHHSHLHEKEVFMPEHIWECFCGAVGTIHLDPFWRCRDMYIWCVCVCVFVILT